MILRPYQQQAIDRARDAFRHGAGRVCVVAPTGAGKTVIASGICTTARGRVLFLVHRQELADQARATLPAGVHVDTIQRLLASGDRPAADLVIADECHHLVSSEWATVATCYPTMVGLTATPQRADGTPLGDLFNALVVVASYSDLLAAGHLVPCDLYAPNRRESSLAMPVAEAVAMYPGRKILVFCATVAEARAVGDCVDGETPGDLRRDTIARFRDGAIRVLSSVYCLSEGFDVPDASVAILARGFGHVSSYLQAVGRVLRPAAGKSSAVVVDLVGSSLEHGMPTEDRHYSLDGDGISRRGKPVLWGCKACGLYLPAPPPDRLCPSCGERMPEPKALVVARRRLARKERDALATPDEKSSILRQLLDVARQRGYRPGWAAAVFHGRFGHWPPRHAA